MHLRCSFAVLALLAACGRGTPAVASGGPGADEYAVWSAAVDARFGAKHSRFVVSEKTFSLVTASPFDVQQLRRGTGLSRELVKDYLARNDHPARVLSGRLHPRDVSILPRPDGPAGRVAEAVSDGTLGLSRVGFDRGGNRALVTVTYNCGGLCGEGGMLVLERDGSGHWRQTATVMDINF
jgi:hypothetical protein